MTKMLRTPHRTFFRCWIEYRGGCLSIGWIILAIVHCPSQFDDKLDWILFDQ